MFTGAVGVHEEHGKAIPVLVERHIQLQFRGDGHNFGASDSDLWKKGRPAVGLFTVVSEGIVEV